jgi:hypothetical protein
LPLARLVALLVTTAMLAFAAAGCGGGSSSTSATKLETWADSVCGALDTWVNDVVSESKSLASDLRKMNSDLRKINPETVKSKFVSFLEDAKASTETVVDTVRSIGAPNVEDGAAIQRDIEEGLSDVRASLDRAVVKAKKLKTSNRQAFFADLDALGQQMITEVHTTSDQLNKLDYADDLEEVMEDACEPLPNSSS